MFWWTVLIGNASEAIQYQLMIEGKHHQSVVYRQYYVHTTILGTST